MEPNTDEIVFMIYITLVICTCIYRKKNNKQKRKRIWVRKLNLSRNIDGYFVSVFEKAKQMDSEIFFKNTRMRRPVYDLFLNLMKDRLQKMSNRPPLSPEFRLAVTLS